MNTENVELLTIRCMSVQRSTVHLERVVLTADR